MKQQNESNKGNSTSFTGRIAGWSARHRWMVLIGTVMMLVAAFGLNGAFGVETTEVVGAGEAQEAWEMVEDRFDIVEPADELILFYNPNVDAADNEFSSTVEPLVQELRDGDYEGVVSVMSYYDVISVDRETASGMISADRHVVVARLVFEAAEPAELEKWIEPVMDAVAESNEGMEGTGYEVSMLGGTSANVAMNTLVNEEMGLIMMVALIGGFIILLLAFGSPVAAIVPLLLALVTVFAAVGAAVPVSRLQALNFYYYEMIVLIGLAVGTDYSLFIINRFREERENGKSKVEAIMTACSTTGRAVFYAGVTVMVSVAGLILTQDSLFIGLGAGAMIVVFFSLIASLTLLPALMAILGDKLNWARIKGLGRPSNGGGIWGFITDKVMARPAIFASVTVIGLLVLAMPLFTLHIGSTPVSTDTIPDKLEGYRALELMEEHFGGMSEFSALAIVVDPGEEGDVNSPQIQEAVADLIENLKQNNAFTPPFSSQVNTEGNLMVINAPVVNPEDDNMAKAAVLAMRDEIVPAVFTQEGYEVLVAGGEAYAIDATDNVKATAPIVFAFVLGIAFILLLVMFRSIIIPVKAIILNLISVGAAYGVLVLVFQEGVIGESLLNFKAVGVIEIFMPLFLFAVLFGLSMDYHMLVLSRIKEAYDSGFSNDESVSIGIKKTASLITSAAAIMILVFGAFAFSSAMFMKQMGVGLGVAILIDATLIRAVLLPASMKLLGERNWYLPSWLEWLPQINLGEGSDVETGKAAAAGREQIQTPNMGILNAEPMRLHHKETTENNWS